ncbi:hypothetical protein DL991_41245 [Amycolatopsis sp. WAC 01375]|uniref:hypothetical protein n=1 Tax=Amycolatopsis sp. WAC 01375 TaxID=2203194 RepID=UPI000F775514|nr:hypothetical protein [Amycolatopsis sp. WAC 01375]RSM68698.1 hypothetical protein DL991_41245 [Amycolatopsis sp. WAC 01375]
MPLTKTQQALLEEMKDALHHGTWERVSTPYGFTIRYTENRTTPEGIPRRWWPEKTYDRHQFLTLHHRGVIYGDVPAPWVGRKDSHITYKRAFAILRDPAVRWESRPTVSEENAPTAPTARSDD